MLNVFTKTKPWMLASLIAASSVFAQQDKNNNCRTPKAPEPMPAPMTAAYNAPSRVDVRGAWDFYVDASFIYWLPNQDNMEFGLSSEAIPGSASANGTAAVPVSNHLVNLNTNFKPGFQVGGGMMYDYDNWDSYLQYTWFHNTNSSSSTGPDGGSVFAVMGHPDTGAGTSFNSASANWHLKMDLADWQLARSYYVGTKLTFRPYFGIRAAWIRQNYSQTYVSTVEDLVNTISVTNKSTSWGIGPSTGLTANYLFGYGFRIFGDLMGDVIYTRYNTSIHQSETADVDFKAKESGINTLRAHTNIDLGVAWASYFDNNNWHVDFLASYGFQVFWNQNMFRRFVDDTMPGNSLNPNGDLYIQGLTLTARLDF